MKKNNFKIKSFVFVQTLLLCFCVQASSLRKVAQSGMQYLKIGVDAQMVGRGEAGISLSEGIQAVFWNPAGLSEIQGQGVFISHNSWIADISFDAFAYGYNLGNLGSIAVSAMWVDYGELKATSVAHSLDESNESGYIDEGIFQPVDLAFGLAYARKISSQFSMGGQVRYLYESYGSNVIVLTNGEEKKIDNTISAYSFDLGTRYLTGFKSLVFSMAIQNFSPDMKYHYESFSPPLTFKMGLAMDLLDFFNNKSRSQLLVAVDALHPRDYTERLNLGLEYDYLGMFQLRSGYRMNYDEGEFAIGGGLRYPINNMQLRCDISYLVMSSKRFSSPMQITVGINF